MSEPETKARYASSASREAHTGNAGAEKGAGLGQQLMDGGKSLFKKSDDFRQGINAFADNTIQPSAARDADRGVAASHKGDYSSTTHGTGGGDEIIEGPARGTGTSGPFTGTSASGGHTGMNSSGSRSSFSSDAQKLGRSMMDKINQKSSGSSGSSTR